MDKQTLRASITTSRRSAAKAADDERRHARAIDIANQGIALAKAAVAQAAVAQADLAPGTTIASYDALPTEPPTDRLNADLVRAGFRVVLPVHEVDGVYLDEMQWIDSASGDVVARSNDEFARLDCAVVFTPALAAGRDGTRMGKGKGFYDRFFATLPRSPEGPARIVIVGTDEVFDSVPTEPHDEPTDGLIAG